MSDIHSSESKLTESMSAGETSLIDGSSDVELSPEFQTLAHALSVHGISCLMFLTNQVIQSDIDATSWNNEQQLRPYEMNTCVAETRNGNNHVANSKGRIQQSVISIWKLEKA